MHCHFYVYCQYCSIQLPILLYTAVVTALYSCCYCFIQLLLLLYTVAVLLFTFAVQERACALEEELQLQKIKQEVAQEHAQDTENKLKASKNEIETLKTKIATSATQQGEKPKQLNGLQRYDSFDPKAIFDDSLDSKILPPDDDFPSSSTGTSAFKKSRDLQMLVAL